MISVRGATKRFSDATHFSFDLQVDEGASLGVIGASGAGKSTLLQMIAGFLPLDSGLIELDGAVHHGSDPASRPVSMVFQSNNVFDHLDVATNVGLGISPTFRKSADSMAVVKEALASVGLEGFEARRAAGLSGGETQRVALARTLVRHKPILLLDEPFAALGPSMRADFTGLVSTMQKERGLTMLTVSHAPDELVGLCEELAFVADGQIAARGETRAMLKAPPHRALAAYLGNANA